MLLLVSLSLSTSSSIVSIMKELHEHEPSSEAFDKAQEEYF